MRNSLVSKIPFILLLLAVAVIATATFVEGRSGSAYARQAIYGTWWFVALWGMIAVAGCGLLYKRKMWRRPSVFLLHLSFLFILLGAFITHVTSRGGMTHLREGEATRTYWVKNDQGAYVEPGTLPFYLALHDFRILYDADGITPADYVSQVVVSTPEGKEEFTISMNNIGRVRGYRIYQTSYDDDELGSVFTISYDPWGTAVTYVGYLLMAFSMLWISVKKGRKKATEEKGRSWLPTILLAFCGTVMASYMVISICRAPLLPVLRSPFLVVHVSTIMIGYILLVVSLLRREVLRPAIFFLAVGIFLGAIWANVSWGTYWSWDPKESWALVTLLLYSLPLHEESLPWFRSVRNYRIYALLCLASLLMTYFGVNYLLGGMHRYAG